MVLCKLKLGMDISTTGNLIEEANQLNVKFKGKQKTTITCQVGFERSSLSH